MRIKLTQKNVKRLFRALGQNDKNLKEIAVFNGVSTRTINDWKRGVTTIPFSTFENLISLTSLDSKKLSPKLLQDFWHSKKAGKKGAQSRMRLYGNFGTSHGRKRGGFNSLKTHKKNNTGFKLLEPVSHPKPSKKLAELLGIFIGDGHLSHYQASMTTNSKTDMQHALYTQDLIKDLFHVNASVKELSGENTVNVVVSSRNLVNFLSSKGMPTGNKIKSGLGVPAWITNNIEYKKSFIRGLFDTDGCIYLDKHTIKGKIYSHMGWTITSYAGMLINDIIRIMKELGFSPTWRRTQRSVFLRKQNEIQRYFAEIGSSNNKHLNRLNQFKGEVPKWS